MYSPETTKYLIHIHLEAEGVVEKSDVVGAIFGQTEGLLGEDMDLRDLQRTGRVGRIDVQVISRKGETRGEIQISSSLDKAETALLAASLETIDRVGPCNSRVIVERIEDIRITKRKRIIERAKSLLIESFDEGTIDTNEILDVVREYSRIEKVVELGDEHLPAGPNVENSDAIIVVEGRADVINLLRYGIKNAVAVEGTNVPASIIDLCERKTATVFLDGDRGGDLILSELLQIADIDYVAICPRNRSVEDMSRKEIVKALRNKMPVEYITDPQRDVDQKTPILKKTVPEAIEVGENVKNSEAPTKQIGGAINEFPNPDPLKEHLLQVGGHGIARFLSNEFKTVQETDADSFEGAVDTLNGSAAGLVIDRMVDQNLLDFIAGIGLEFVAAPDFKGIIKKPVSVKLVKIP